MASASIRTQAKKAGSALKEVVKDGARKVATGARRRLRERGPKLTREFLQGIARPVGAGAAGAIGADMLLDRFRLFGGAKGDVAKLVAGLAIGFANQQTLRSADLQNAANGIVVINAYKFGTRLLNRGVSGKGLAGLMADDSNSDLAGFWNGDAAGYEAVAIEFTDGSAALGYRDAYGNVYDQQGALLAFDDEQELQGLPADRLPGPTKRLVAGGVVAN